jgi:hypothetical protein
MGPAGPTGATGATGPAGPSLSLPRVSLFSTTSQSLAPGTGVAFDVQGFVSADVFTPGPSSVTVNIPGTYMVLWSASVTNTCALGVTLDRVQVNGLTSSGNAGRIFAHALVDITTVPTVLKLQSRLGTPCAIAPEIPVLAPASVSGTLIIVKMQ